MRRNLAAILVIFMCGLWSSPAAAWVQPADLTTEDLAVCTDAALLERLDRERSIPCRSPSTSAELRTLCAALLTDGMGSIGTATIIDCAPTVLHGAAVCTSLSAARSGCADPADPACRAALVHDCPAAMDGDPTTTVASTADMFAVPRPVAGAGAGTVAALALPGFTPGTLAMGWVDLALARAASELAIMMQRSMGEALCGNGVPTALRGLFPDSCVLLAGPGAATTPPSLDALATAVTRDLRALPANALALVPVSPQSQCALQAVISALVHQISTAPSAATFATDLETEAATHCSQSTNTLTREALVAIARVLRDEVAVGTPRDTTTIANTVLREAVLSSADLGGYEAIAPRVRRVIVATSNIRSGVGDPAALRNELVSAVCDLARHVVERALPGATNAADRAVALSLIRAVEAVGCEQYLEAALALFTGPLIDQIGVATNSAALQRIARVARTLGEVADADTAEEVREILDDAAAPLGSWREYRRRNAGFIATTVGVSGAMEYALDSRAQGIEDSGFGASLSLTVPVAFEMAIVSAPWPLLLQITIADLGAFASARLDGSATGTTGEPAVQPNVDFVSLLSPGVYLGMGLGDTPLAVYLGASVAPSLREHFVCTGATACGEMQAFTVIRGPQLILAVDLPLFPLF